MSHVVALALTWELDCAQVGRLESVRALARLTTDSVFFQTRACAAVLHVHTLSLSTRWQYAQKHWRSRVPSIDCIQPAVVAFRRFERAQKSLRQSSNEVRAMVIARKGSAQSPYKEVTCNTNEIKDAQGTLTTAIDGQQTVTLCRR